HLEYPQCGRLVSSDRVGSVGERHRLPGAAPDQLDRALNRLRHGPPCTMCTERSAQRIVRRASTRGRAVVLRLRRVVSELARDALRGLEQRGEVLLDLLERRDDLD